MGVFGNSVAQQMTRGALVAVARGLLAGLTLAVLGGIIALLVGWRPATWALALDGIGHLALAAGGGTFGFALGEFVASSRARIRASEPGPTVERVKKQDVL